MEKSKDENTTREKGWNLENSYMELPNIFYSKLNPSPVKSPKLIFLNESVSKELGLNPELLKTPENIEILAGNRSAAGSVSIAQAYAGHQFGYFTKLGDGRALLVGEQINDENERFDIQLKGSGPTPYSRGGDGRASLGPMIREYIMSEAMHALGVPTTRSLSVIETGESIFRESRQRGAVLARVAKSHIRVGTFQYAHKFGSESDVKSLADYTLKRHFKEGINEANPYTYLLEKVIERQAGLIAKWQLIGFIHGVMNTDNMSIAGETIDYGPCAFMDSYDPETVFSSIDIQGRYAYQNQPYIGAWNLSRFAETLIPLLDENNETALEIATKAVEKFGHIYQKHYISGMRFKLGLFNEEKEDISLIQSLLEIMEKYCADYTFTFNALTRDKLEDTVIAATEEFKEWKTKWEERLQRQENSLKEVKSLMEKSNPVVIPRNHRVEEAIEAAVTQSDYSVAKSLLSALENPYSYEKENLKYSLPPEKPNASYKTYCGT